MFHATKRKLRKENPTLDNVGIGHHQWRPVAILNHSKEFIVKKKTMQSYVTTESHSALTHTMVVSIVHELVQNLLNLGFIRFARRTLTLILKQINNIEARDSLKIKKCKPSIETCF